MIAAVEVPPQARPRPAVLRNEVLLVLGVSLGASAVYSILDIINKLTLVQRLSQQTTHLNQSVTPDRPWLDLTYQLVRIVFLVVPALLAVHLLNRDPEGAPARLGLDLHRRWFDLGTGVGLAALIGVPGLALYAAARALGINTNVAAANLTAQWWTVPVLVLAAAANAVLEEIVVVGYLVNRLRDIGWQTAYAVLASAVLRGSYHLYQGFGAFLGNAIMGVVFALFFLRFKRVIPLIIAHTILDVVAFVGYTLLKDHLGFL
jgi:membrane protease YdiL (CAAX protease family)